LSQRNIKHIQQYTNDKCKNITYLRFDFHLPDHNKMIEFNGAQHYRPVDVFGGEDAFNKRVINDNIKKKYCKDNNITLHIIRYDQNIIDELNSIFPADNIPIAN